MRRLLNQIKIQSQLSDQYAKPIIGFVSSYDPDNYCCKITVQPEDSVSGSREIISGWIPVCTIWAGNGWGLFCPPAIGDKVEVDFQESDFEAGHVDWRFYDDDNRPVRAESGVFYIIHKTGSCLKFENNGTVTLQAAQFNIDAYVKTSGHIEIGSGFSGMIAPGKAAIVKNGVVVGVL